MGKNRLLLTALIATICLATGGYIWWQQSNNSEDETSIEENQATANQGLSNLTAVDSGKLDFEFDVETLPVDDSTRFKASLSGELNFDKDDTSNTASLLTADLSLESASATINMEDISLLNRDDKTYFKVDNLTSNQVDINDWGLNLSQIANKWYLLDQVTTLSDLNLLPEQASDLKQSDIDPSLTFDIENLINALADSQLLDSVTKLDDERIDEIDTSHYSFTNLDASSTASVLAQLNETGTPLSQDDISRLEAELNKVNLSGEIWIDKTSSTIKKLTLAISPLDETGLSLAIDINLGEINSTVSLEEPTEVDDFANFLQGISTFPQLVSPEDDLDNTSADELDDLNENDDLPELP